MKKILQSKGFIVASLAVLCVAIVGVCWYVGLDKSDPFLPDESPPASTTDSTWSESNSLTEGGNGAGAYTSPQSTKPTEEYPKVVKEVDNEVIIDFSDTEKIETTPPPAPEGKIIQEDTGPVHEVNPDPEVTAPATEPQERNEPTAGSSNGNGAIYDPVFGWVVPGDIQQSIGDSDGDINKMVGSMGE